MSQSLNVIQIIGRLGKAPEMKYTPSGKAVTSFSVATDRKYTGADGKLVDETTWHNVKVWGKAAEASNQFLDKGRLVFVQGRQDHRRYEDPKTKETRYFSEITADQVIFLDKAPNGPSAPAAEAEETIDFSVTPESGF